MNQMNICLPLEKLDVYCLTNVKLGSIIPPQLIIPVRKPNFWDEEFAIAPFYFQLGLQMLQFPGLLSDRFRIWCLFSLFVSCWLMFLMLTTSCWCSQFFCCTAHVCCFINYFSWCSLMMFNMIHSTHDDVLNGRLWELVEYTLGISWNIHIIDIVDIDR